MWADKPEAKLPAEEQELHGRRCQAGRAIHRKALVRKAWVAWMQRLRSEAVRSWDSDVSVEQAHAQGMQTQIRPRKNRRLTDFLEK